MRHAFAALALATVAGHAMAEDGYTAKSLFFGEDDNVRTVATSTAPAISNEVAVAENKPDQAAPVSAKKARVVKVSTKKVANVGASYFIRLKQPDGSTHDVLARRVFKSGEHFQLGVKVNHPSYIYILNEGPDGSITQIYPQRSQDNFVDAMGVVFLPARGSFVFDDKPGMEKLMVYLSPEPVRGDLRARVGGSTPDFVSTSSPTLAQACVPQPNGAIADAPTPASSDGAPLKMASADTGYAAKGIAFSDDKTACAAPVAAAAGPNYAAKGIAFSDDAAPTAGGQVASYVVKPATASDANLYLKINLAHE
ncbi:hypothetical protein AWB74_08093 [Caballeronia arvi]|uniref:DUF4384 domain-containing protein n=1 Tax=Caballeronia arvi TaxID=1777135 RepID=A0A158L1X3_9BURK|nr:DUF4384 domain-containing protein [Caballeronia arvi]SAL87384.1 hypothetical protein AWB74_08093 [Caballeronia arvi]